MDHTSILTDVTHQLLDQLELPTSVDFQVTYSPDSDSYQVNLETDHPGLVIGYHGETLVALQQILSQHIYSQTNQWLKLTVNVNDYRERREANLVSLADSVAARVISTGQPHTLPPMSPSERRFVHMHLADHPQVSTVSEGVGRSRSIVVSPKNITPQSPLESRRETHREG